VSVLELLSCGDPDTILTVQLCAQRLGEENPDSVIEQDIQNLEERRSEEKLLPTRLQSGLH
jgi:hypothetical protein